MIGRVGCQFCSSLSSGRSLLVMFSDFEEELSVNPYWAELVQQWEPYTIDLGEDDPSIPCSIFLNRSDSVSPISSSPYTIERFKKMLACKCWDKPTTKNITPKNTCVASTQTDMIDEVAEKIYQSWEKMCGYIDSIYSSIDPEMKKLVLRESAINKSVSFSNISYDDSVIEKSSSEENVINVSIKSLNYDEKQCATSEDEYCMFKFERIKNFWKSLTEDVAVPKRIFEKPGFDIEAYDNHEVVVEDYDTIYLTCNDQADAETSSSEGYLSRKSLVLEDYECFVKGATLSTNSDNHENDKTVEKSKIHDIQNDYDMYTITVERIESVKELKVKMYQSFNNEFEPPENDLQKNSTDRVLSEHQLRVQRSLQKLDLPDWYKNSPIPREGFLLKKRASDAGASTRGWETPGLGSKTTSLGSLGAGAPLTRSPLALTLPSQQIGFTRWSTSRLNSAQTSPCSSARSSLRGGAISPLTSPARPPRAPRPSRPPYLGWRSQERLASPRTPHERLAGSLLPHSPPVSSNVSDEIQTSIKEVTSAIVHYVSGLEPCHDKLNVESNDISASPRNSPRYCWLESSFVGTKPLESPQTPIVVAQLSPPQPQNQQRPLQLNIPSSRPTANGNVTLSTTTYQHDWQASQHSLLNLAINKPSPGSTTLEDVLDSLLGLPSSAPRIPSPQTSPRRVPSPYYILGSQNRYSDYSHTQTNSLQLNLPLKLPKDITDNCNEVHSNKEVCNSVDIFNHDGEYYDRRKSSAESSSCSTLAPGTDGAYKEDIMASLPKFRSRAKSAIAGKQSNRRQSEPAAGPKSQSLDRRTSYDSHIAKGELTLSRTSLSDIQQSRTSLKSITSINTDGSGEDLLVHCRYTKCTSATTQVDARKNYKSCHNCNYLYCSRECRRAHWEKHRKVCLHSRASTLCKQILSTAKEDSDSLHHISLIAQRGYLSQGRGVVRVFFTSPDAAEKFTMNGFQSLGEPVFVKWPDLIPNEMGPELYAELIKLCKNYNPETRLVLYVAVCIVSEVPTKGAAVKWERQIVSRCAKLRLSATVTNNLASGQIPIYSSPTTKIKNKELILNDDNLNNKTENTETLILTSNSANLHQKNNISMQKLREISFSNIQMQLQKRGVNLKKHYPEVYTKLCSYVEGTCDKFTPITIYPRDILTGKSFMCVIMPETEPEKFSMLPNDSIECRTVDVSIDHVDQVSTPM